MQRSFVAKNTINFPGFDLYVRVGDVLVYNSTNDNCLTVYRGGAIVRTIRATPISIAAMTKTKMIEESVTPSSKRIPVAKVVAKPKSPKLGELQIRAKTAIQEGGVDFADCGAPELNEELPVTTPIEK
jgi:hypothetical protein